jgi:large subunit ribosomal protein L1
MSIPSKKKKSSFRGFGKRMRANLESKPATALAPAEAIKALRTFKAPKFDQTVNVVVNLGIDPKAADQALRGSIAMPHGIGRSARVVCFCQSDKVAAAKAAGAVEAGGDELVAKIEGGWMDFDVAVASPDMMRVVSKLGKVLGPKGLMPSPKAGTVTPDVAAAVKEYGAGKQEYRNDDGGNVHCVLGKMSFNEPQPFHRHHRQGPPGQREGHLPQEVRDQRRHEPWRAGGRLNTEHRT